MLFDRSEANVEALAPVTIESTHTLQIAKQAEPAFVLPGSLITYTIAYTITGNEPVFGVMVRDVTPENTTFVSGNPTPTSAPTPGGTGEVQWALGDMLLASSGITQVAGVVTLVVQANASLPADITLVTNTASIEDDSGQRDTASVTQTVPADVAVTKAVTPAIVLVGQTLTYTLVVSNNGPGLAQDVVITDVLPAELTFVSASSSYSGPNPLTWQLGNLIAGQSLTLQVVAIAPASMTVLTNTATVGASSPETRLDNNTAIAPVAVGQPVLQIAKSVSQGNGAIVKPGEQLTYTLIVTNAGNLPATNVLLTDTLPESTTYVDGSAAPAPVINGTTLVWDAGTLLPGQSFTASFAVQVPATPTSQMIFRNAALVSSQEVPEIISNEVINTLRPSIIQLASFDTRRVASSTVEIEWVTLSERNTFGFTLLRSAFSNAQGAERISGMITALGAENTRTAYQFADEAAPAGQLYYWLEETELDGKVNLYGPFELTPGQAPSSNRMMPRVYAPMLMR